MLLCKTISLRSMQPRTAQMFTTTQSSVINLPAIVGRLNWIALRTRPDIAWATSRATSLIRHDPYACFTRVKHICQYLYHTLGYVLGYVPIPPETKHNLWVMGDASFAPTGEKRVNKAWLCIMESLLRTTMEGTSCNGVQADKTSLQSPLVRQNWLPQVKLFSKERTLPLRWQRWPIVPVRSKCQVTTQPRYTWSGMVQRRPGEQGTSVWRHCGCTRWPEEEVHKLRIYVPTTETATDSLTKGLGASRLPWIRENLKLIKKN